MTAHQSSTEVRIAKLLLLQRQPALDETLEALAIDSLELLDFWMRAEDEFGIDLRDQGVDVSDIKVFGDLVKLIDDRIAG